MKRTTNLQYANAVSEAAIAYFPHQRRFVPCNNQPDQVGNGTNLTLLSFLVMATSCLVTVTAALILNPGLSHVVSDRIQTTINLSIGSGRFWEPLVPSVPDAHSKQVKYVTQVIERVAPKNKEKHHLAHSIVTESMKAGYDPLLVTAIIKSESTFNRKAMSRVGATGLMQLRPSTGKYISTVARVGWAGQSKLTDPAYNIRLGIAYIKYLERKFGGSKEWALMAYNWGPENLRKALKRGGRLPSGPTTYAKRILKNHSSYKAEFAKVRTSTSFA